MSRPLVTVQPVDGAKADSVSLPAVLIAPIRPDIVHTVHSNMAKNKRQPYSVKWDAGHQHSAESWGTGRAVSRIPRISGGGTHRAGQAAFGNMCRKGRMFAPTKIWRKWHRRINTNQKRYAVVSALAASALPSLVMARGHRISEIPEVPLVVSDNIQEIKKTSKAVEVLVGLNAYADVEKVIQSKKLHSGVGKMRNRRYVQRRGPLIVFDQDEGITQAFRNLPGVELVHVDRLNLLQLAPGGHLGRFVIWTHAAFIKLDSIFGTERKLSQQKHGYKLPRPIMANSDLVRIINSEEIQSKLNPAKPKARRAPRHKNPLKNLGAMVRLNPYALALRRAELVRSRKKRAATPAEKKAHKKHCGPKVLNKPQGALSDKGPKVAIRRLQAESEYSF